MQTYELPALFNARFTNIYGAHNKIELLREKIHYITLQKLLEYIAKVTKLASNLLILQLTCGFCNFSNRKLDSLKMMQMHRNM